MSFERFGYIDLENDFMNEAFELAKGDTAQTTQNAKNFMAKSFNNKDWATRNPKILKGTSVTADAY